MNKARAFFNLFRAGYSVVNPVFWKTISTASQGAIVALLLALVGVANAFGVDIIVSEQTAGIIAAALIAVIGMFTNVATSDKVGIGQSERQSDILAGEPVRVQDTSSSDAIARGNVQDIGG